MYTMEHMLNNVNSTGTKRTRHPVWRPRKNRLIALYHATVQLVLLRGGKRRSNSDRAVPVPDYFAMLVMTLNDAAMRFIVSTGGHPPPPPPRRVSVKIPKIIV
jgi:hypothetical protein